MRRVFDHFLRHRLAAPEAGPIRRSVSGPAAIVSIAWLLLLIAPAATTFSAWHDWDVNNRYLFYASCAVIVGLRLTLRDRAFYIVTYPVALVGIACVVASEWRQVDLLELAMQWRGFSGSEIESSLRPYAWPAAATALALAGLASWAGQRGGGGSMSYRYAAAALLGAAALLALPGAVWPRAWPINALLVGASTTGDLRRWSPILFPNSATINPRNPGAHWSAARGTIPSDREAYVLVIGESIRSDYLRECGGPGAVTAIAPGALVACDVTAGSDSTHSSVPLLVSRELPGHAVRVSSDATFLHAFSEVGFETYWYGVQGQTIAWPDAGHEAYFSQSALDRELLLPPLSAALREAQTRQAIVLHAYNAHDPYCLRYEASTAPLRTACPKAGDLPEPDTVPLWRIAYTNAIDESVRFLNAVIARLDRQPGEAFLIFTPDHAENLLDDRRALFLHALRHPTRWDIRVPAVFWANAAWKRTHASEWAQLERNVTGPLMHADLAPTLLGAADIRYEEPRGSVVNLLAAEVPRRERLVQWSLGAVTDWESLVQEAR